MMSKVMLAIFVMISLIFIVGFVRMLLDEIEGSGIDALKSKDSWVEAALGGACITLFACVGGCAGLVGFVAEKFDDIFILLRSRKTD